VPGRWPSSPPSRPRRSTGRPATACWPSGRIREEPDFETHGWWRVAYLDAACFLLTRNARYVGLLARNLSHGSSSIRMGLIPAMGLVIPHVEPLELDIVEPVGRLMLNRAMYADAALCLLLAARMHPDKKRRIMREWLEAGPPGQVRALLERALSHGYVENSLMVEEYLGILSHLVTLSLEADPGSSEPRGPVQPLDFASRVRAHLLLSPLIAVGNS
jgi:hypothetical protein